MALLTHDGFLVQIVCREKSILTLQDTNQWYIFYEYKTSWTGQWLNPVMENALQPVTDYYESTFIKILNTVRLVQKLIHEPWISAKFNEA